MADTRMLILVGVVLVLLTLGVVLYVQLGSSSGSVDCSLSCGTWSTCTDPCGSGVQRRSCTVAVMPRGPDALPCDVLEQTQSCPVTPDCASLDCVPGVPAPGGWSGCPACVDPASTVGPTEWQFVAPKQEARGGGAPCDFSQILQTRPCPQDLPACEDRDCVFGESFLTPCTGGLQTEIRTLVQNATGNGTCDWSQLIPRVVPCSTVTSGCAPPTQWSECSVACGVGTQVGASPDCGVLLQQPCSITACTTVSGQVCQPPTPEQVLARCLEPVFGMAAADWQPPTQPWDIFCGVPGYTCPTGGSVQDCQLSDWSAWGTCSSGGIQRRTRSIVSLPTLGGQPCASFPLVDVQSCTMPPAVDCQLGPLTPLGGCSKPCGGGLQAQVATVVQLPSGEGAAPCPTDPRAYYTLTSCNTQPCDNCVYQDWSTYLQSPGAQVTACAGGTQVAGPRPVVAPAGPGGACDPSQAYRTQSC